MNYCYDIHGQRLQDTPILCAITIERGHFKFETTITFHHTQIFLCTQTMVLYNVAMLLVQTQFEPTAQLSSVFFIAVSFSNSMTLRRIFLTGNFLLHFVSTEGHRLPGGLGFKPTTLRSLAS